MITVKIFRNENDRIYGFEVKNHGHEIVCSAVSILTLNTANSIEQFTDAPFSCDYNEEGGFFRFTVDGLKNGEDIPDAELLLKSMEFGLLGIKAEPEYERHINIINVND